MKLNDFLSMWHGHKGPVLIMDYDDVTLEEVWNEVDAEIRNADYDAASIFALINSQHDCICCIDIRYSDFRASKYLVPDIADCTVSDFFTLKDGGMIVMIKFDSQEVEHEEG